MSWQYVEIVETFQDVAKKYRVRVLISDSKTEETVFFKFHKEPSEEEVQAMTQIYVDNREAQEQIAAIEAKIAPEVEKERERLFVAEKEKASAEVEK